MAKQLGRNAKIAVSSDDITYNDIGNITSSSWDGATDKAESTDADSGGAKEELQTDEQYSLDVTSRYNISDTAQAALLTSEENKTQLYYRIRPREVAGEKEWKFQGNINSVSLSAPHADVEEIQIGVTSTGAITRATQT